MVHIIRLSILIFEEKMKELVQKIVSTVLMIIIISVSLCYWTHIEPFVSAGITQYKEGASIISVVKTLDAKCKNSLIQSGEWVNAYGMVQKILGKQEIKNYLIISDDERSLYRVQNEQTDEEISLITRDIERIYETTLECEGEFLYVQVPYKCLEPYITDRGYPIDYCNANYNKLLVSLEMSEIPCVDLREVDGKWEYYKTDHHWTSNSAFVATGEIVNVLDSMYGLNLDNSNFYKNRDNYSEKVYKSALLGSSGIHVGEYYSGMDDVEILIPRFETNFIYQHYIEHELVGEYKGDFWTAFIDEELLEDEGYYNKYNCFLHAGYYENIIINTKSNNDKKVLLITHSYGRPMAQYMSLFFSETRYLDPQEGRYNDNYLDYIREYKPDVVIVMYNDRITVD